MTSGKIRWARSATKHRVSRVRIEHVIEHSGLVLRVPAPSGRSEERLLFLGDDASGTALEVMAVELADDRILVIHAMALRSRYLDEYEEARRWRL